VIDSRPHHRAVERFWRLLEAGPGFREKFSDLRLGADAAPASVTWRLIRGRLGRMPPSEWRNAALCSLLLDIEDGERVQ